MSRTTVILINYNSKEYTLDCIKSIIKSSSKPNIVVVDNNSEDKDIEDYTKNISVCKVIYNKINEGFAKANNIGIKWALKNTKSEFIFILNNDTVIKADTIEKLETALESDKSSGIAVPRILFMDMPKLLWYDGGEVNWKKGGATVYNYMKPINHNSSGKKRKITFASGCAMLIRREILEKIGGFDPRFFMYEEDLEFSLRVIRHGWEIKYVPEATLMHKVQGSIQKKEPKFMKLFEPNNPNLSFYAYHRTKNKLLTMCMHAKGINALKFWSLFPIYWSLICMKFLIYRRFDAVGAILRGVVAALKTNKINWQEEI